ncbi:uncharacterized protein TRIVIDRAFT_46616 [Trichoderma virens Gv29-8]|uniref:Prion-inhibition and propagation HeLo domain-containing protein n=1 Tax=Hypocrea virens (strain Gv29-8 / FGSC 10586) TaxID=413071 RepID=G9N1P6_HYPVG|nr:uncharacterized protein TRIVIDRAFT_46616 [Trichoderma virens Gv29-8]EHK19675.1 hypothetical protein TRIVIDRAFT_46616 [Trichoderma virens Gv29-8]UKZ58073.1 hypothetical protein TrVGV298_011938 [Trichoderma virens]UKZ83774.1 hypothetical protein TrVFT333_011587 [Trichoderma virens FT-333]
MDAVGGAAGIFHFLQQGCSRVNQVRGFEDEFRIYQLHLQMQRFRCDAVSRIIHNIDHNKNTLSANAILDSTPASPQEGEPTLAGLLAEIQHALHKAQREAARIRDDCGTQVPTTGFLDKRKTQAAKTIQGVKWAFYKRDNCINYLGEISSLILNLEHQVDRELLALGDAGLMYMARRR